MKEKKKLLYVAGLLLALGIVAILTVDTAMSKPPEKIRPIPQWVYSAKFVCGDPGPLGPLVGPAIYKTAINVHNPQDELVNFTKKVVIAESELDPLIPPSGKRFFELKPDWAFEIDCRDIQVIWGTGPIPFPQFAKGFVVITTPKQLDVIGVYTSSTTTDITLDVEAVEPKRIKDADP